MINFDVSDVPSIL
jgi:hypothetical protein